MTENKRYINVFLGELVVLALMWDFSRLVNLGKEAEYIREEAFVDTMRRADEEMYENKAILKKGMGIR